MSMNSAGFSGHHAFGSVLPATSPTPVVERPVMVENNFATLPNPPSKPIQTVPYSSPYAGKNVNFFRIIKSEWLKLWTLRSTWWVVALTIVLMAGFALLFATVMRTTLNNPDALAAMAAAAEAGEGGGGPGGGFGGGGSALTGGFSAVNIVTLGLQFAQLTVAVLGVLMITNEYSSGMIRATFSAAPHRATVLLAKLLVLLITTLLVAAIGLALAWLVTFPLLNDVALINPVDFASATDVRALIGAILYLMAIAALALGIGALIRATAGGIFTVVALLMVLPMIFQIILFASDVAWARTIFRYLPTQAGERIYQVGEFGTMGLSVEVLDPWPGFIVLLAYALLAYIAATIVMRRRDA